MSKKENNTTVLSEKRKVKGAGLLIHRGVLLILSENFFGKSFVIEKPEVIIGRHSSCDISVKDPQVSKVHCSIMADDEGKFYIEDRKSKNGVFLNKKKVRKKTRILYGDRIVMGNTVFRFFMEEKINKK